MNFQEFRGLKLRTGQKDKKYPEKLIDVVPEYLEALPTTLEPRYLANGEMYIDHVNILYNYQDPLKYDETEFSQYYCFRFEYFFGPEFYYLSDRKKWHISPD